MDWQQVFPDRSIKQIRPLQGGSIGQVYRVDFAEGEPLVAKVAGADGTLDLEGRMLQYLAAHSPLPVPVVQRAEPGLLVMTYIPGHSNLSAAIQADAARHVSALHRVYGQAFGFDYDTLIGGLHQPNPWTDSWVTFFREHRLLYMAQTARRAGRLPAELHRRVEALAARIGDFIAEPARPVLLHGDLWTTNILADDGRVTAFIDPAIYYGHPEIELAFSTLFGTFGDAFFSAYEHDIAPGFFETRRDIYNLYPLLVHVRLFGSGYVGSVNRILRQCGF
jgi:fructosamine-3-kinase